MRYKLSDACVYAQTTEWLIYCGIRSDTRARARRSIMLMHLVDTNGCSLNTYPGVPVKVHTPCHVVGGRTCDTIDPCGPLISTLYPIEVVHAKPVCMQRYQ